MSSDGTRQRSALPPGRQPATCACTPRGRDVDPVGQTSTARLRATTGSSVSMSSDGTPWRQARQYGTGTFEGTCACTPAAGRGPRWASIDGEAMLDLSGGRYRCRRTARVAIGAYGNSGAGTFAAVGVARAGTWTRCAQTSTARRATTPATRYRCPRTARARSAPVTPAMHCAGQGAGVQ